MAEEEENLTISLDKLPIKRVEIIEENGLERYPPDVDYDEKRLNLIRRIDFAWAVEREDPTKKQKTSDDEKDAAAAAAAAASSSSSAWPWQSMVENLKLAHQELSVIIDLIHTVEANDAVTVAGMTRPKLLPNEHLSDLAVSTATKLQCFRQLGKYFKQSAKALEKQIAREARFYGALIRLQQNWKVKRHRVVPSAQSNEGFYIDLFDNSLSDPVAGFRPSSISTVRVEHDAAGMLALNLSSHAFKSLEFGFLGTHSENRAEQSSRVKSAEIKREPANDDEYVKETHSALTEVHRTIFHEQVFDLVNREAFIPSLGVSVTGIRENHLQLNIGQEASVFISLVPSRHEDQVADGKEISDKTSLVPFDKLDGSNLEGDRPRKLLPNRICFEIFLEQLFHEHVFVKAKNRSCSAGRTLLSCQPAKDEINLLNHFCMSLSHRIFSNKVLMQLEALVSRVPYADLISHPTWHSRTSSWTISVKVPQSILQAGRRVLSSDENLMMLFQTTILVTDDCINVEGEGAPNVVGLFKEKRDNVCSMNRYDCDLADLPLILLQQVASQIIHWLHEEAMMVGISARRDFLCLSFELDQGERLGLVAHVDTEDTQGGISWWLVMSNGFSEQSKIHTGVPNPETRKFLGYLSLDVLHSILLDLVSLCGKGG